MFQRREGAGGGGQVRNTVSEMNTSSDSLSLKEKTPSKKGKSKRTWRPDRKRSTRVIEHEHFAEYSVLQDVGTVLALCLECTGWRGGASRSKQHLCLQGLAVHIG